MHEVLVNRLGGLSLPRKSVVRLTDRPDMTLGVYRGRKRIHLLGETTLLVSFLPPFTVGILNSLTTEKQTTKFSSANFQNMNYSY